MSLAINREVTSSKFSPLPGRRRWARSESIVGLLFIAPTLLMLGAIIFYPIVETGLMSFSSVNSLAQRGPFNGLANYLNLFSDSVFSRVVLQTVVWTVSVVSQSELSWPTVCAGTADCPVGGFSDDQRHHLAVDPRWPIQHHQRHAHEVPSDQ
jgi:hypothetical protein